MIHVKYFFTGLYWVTVILGAPVIICYGYYAGMNWLAHNNQEYALYAIYITWGVPGVFVVGSICYAVGHDIVESGGERGK